MPVLRGDMKPSSTSNSRLLPAADCAQIHASNGVWTGETILRNRHFCWVSESNQQVHVVKYRIDNDLYRIFMDFPLPRMTDFWYLGNFGSFTHTHTKKKTSFLLRVSVHGLRWQPAGDRGVVPACPSARRNCAFDHLNLSKCELHDIKISPIPSNSRIWEGSLEHDG